MTILGQVGTGPLPDYSAIAQTIRDAAGIPSTETTGPRYTVDQIGWDGSTLTDKDGFAIGSEANIITQADSGAGTAGDPYIVENKDFDNSESASYAINWNDAAGADYHIKVINCSFGSTYAAAQAFRCSAGGTGSITFQNCTMQGLLAFGFVQGGSGVTITYDRCKVLTGSGDCFKILSAGTTSTLVITDCIISDSGGAWGSVPQGVNIDGAGATVTIQYNTFDFTTGSNMLYAIKAERACAALTIQNNDFNGLGDGGTAGTGIIGGIVDAGPMTFQYNLCRNGNGSYIRAAASTNHDIGYNEFQDNITGYRQVYYSEDLTTTNISGVDIHHNKATKLTGPVGGTSECFMCNGGGAATIRENWVPFCIEDPYEFAWTRAGCSFVNNVADECNTHTEVYGSHPSLDAPIRVSGLYGSANLMGVAFTNRTNDYCENIQIDAATAATNVREEATATVGDGEQTGGIAFVGPIVNVGGGDIYFDEGITGSANTVSGIVGVNNIGEF